MSITILLGKGKVPSIWCLKITCCVDKEGNVNKYVPGVIDKTIMGSLINNVKKELAQE